MCYAAPLVGAVVTTTVWSKTKDVRTWWLMLMFYGGALFGVIDHWWNGELFLISENIVSDLLLGVTISAFILIAWGAMVIASKTNFTLAAYANVKK
ncbi:MAG: hypothetical protein HQ572_02745 [Candidatus Omnitrophica bacterium]|nr:hypothetical protein [Candidatus Omnitrophota bacterium]